MLIKKNSIFQIILQNSKFFLGASKFKNYKKLCILKNLGNMIMDLFPSKKIFGTLVFINQEKLILFETYWKDFWKIYIENQESLYIDKASQTK